MPWIREPEANAGSVGGCSSVRSQPTRSAYRTCGTTYACHRCWSTEADSHVWHPVHIVQAESKGGAVPNTNLQVSCTIQYYTMNNELTLDFFWPYHDAFAF